jgi:ATP synthase protein I
MSEESKFRRDVDVKASRIIAARDNDKQGIWFGLGMTGLVGWSVAVPTLGGAALGIWLDNHYPGGHSWTLALMFVGLAIGCFSAWQWVDQQNKDINSKEDDNE